MSSKIYVLDGALLACNMGYKPAKLQVTENKKVKIQGKFKATDADVQVPQTFGRCKLKPTNSGHLPCVPGLQKWTNTSQKATLGKSKKFLFNCSQTLCTTGGIITIKDHAQINSAGSMTEEFKQLAMLITGVMPGNNRAPAIIKCYWMDEKEEKTIDQINYGQNTSIFVMTENIDAGENIQVTVTDKDQKKIDGQQTQLQYTGTVQDNGTAKLKPFKTQEDWNLKTDRTRILTLKAIADGNTFDFSDQELLLTPPSVKLRFLRYAYLYDNADYIAVKLPPTTSADDPNTKTIELSEVTVLAPPKGAPNTQNFSVHYAPVNAGYLYIFDADNPDLFYEYQIDQQGNYHKIEWDKSKPKYPRKTSGEVRDYVLIEKDKTIWVCYSPIQWTVEFHEKMREKNAQTTYMKRIKCKGFKTGETNKEGIYPYNEVNFSVPKKDKNLADANVQKLQDLDQKDQEENQQENYIKQDMFVAIHDGIGMADDLIECLEIEIANHRASLDAMRFGINPAFPKQHALNHTEFKNITDQNKQQATMFTLAQTTYQLVYNDPKIKYDGGAIGSGIKYAGIKKLPFNTLPTPIIYYDGNGILKEKLIHILGVKERKEQRALIRKLQTDLNNYIKCAYYDKALVQFADDNEIANILGKVNLYNQLSLLAINPHDFDRGIDLKAHQEKFNDQTSILVEKLKTKGSSNFDKTLTKEVNITDQTLALSEEQGIDIVNKAANFVDKVIETISKITTKKILATTIKEAMDITVTQLNRVKFYDVAAYQVQNNQFYEQIPKDSKLIASPDDVAPYRGKLPITRFKIDSPQIVLKESVRGKHTFGVNIATTKTTVTDTPTPTASKAEAFLNSKAFRRSVAILQVFNLGGAMVRMVETRNLKSFTNIAGISAELTEAVLRLKEAKLIRGGGTGFIEGSFASNALKGVSVAGAAITVVMCAWDAYDSFDARDGDAAWAYIGAATAFSGTTVAVAFASASWAGALGWISVGIGIGFMYLAYKLTDSPLEKFFKHIPFSDAVPFARHTHEPVWRYNQRFYAQSNNLMGKGNAMPHLANFTRASAELHDLLVCSTVRFKATQTARNTEEIVLPYKDFMQPIVIKEGYATQFEVSIGFNQFLTDKDQLVFDLYYYPNGSKEMYQTIDYTATTSIKKGTATLAPQAVVNIELPAAIVANANPKSSLLFICKLRLTDHHYYPVKYDCNQRLLGAFIGLKQLEASGVTTYRTYGSHTKIDTKSALLNFTAWNLKK